MLTLWNPLVSAVERSDSKISLKNYFNRLVEDSFLTMANDLFNVPWAGLGIENRKNEDGTITFSIDVPGIKQDDLTIEVSGNLLCIKGIRKTGVSSYQLNKSFSIPESHLADNVKAELVDGVLLLTLEAKDSSSKEIKKIPITSSNK